MKIYIKDIKLFEKLLHSVNRLVPSCKFEIDKDKAEIRGFNDSTVIRAFYETNIITSDEASSFCIAKLANFYKSIQLISEFGDNDTIELNYDGTFIKYSSNTKFKFSTVKEETVEKYISPRLKVTLDKIYGCTLTQPLMKKLSSLSCISNDDKIKVYIYKENDAIMGEIDNKQLRISDSIAIPITKDFYGPWDNIIIVTLDSFRLFNLLDTDSIKFHMTDKKALLIENEIVDKSGNYVKVNLISSILKD